MQSTIELTYPNHGVHWGRDRYKDASFSNMKGIIRTSFIY